MTATPASFAPNGTWWITCQEAIHFKDRNHDVRLEWCRRDGIWDREGLGHTPTLVSSLHELRMRLDEADTSVHAQGSIDADAWTVVGGPITLHIRWQQTQKETWVGSYHGTFAGKSIEGTAEACYEPAAPSSRGASKLTPSILNHFEQTGPRGRLYDFAYAGRGLTDPTQGLRVFQAEAFGVRADSGEECLPAIQRALDAAADAGGGVVQLPAGVLDCNVDTKLPPLRIRGNRVVLRGSGCELDGTLLVNHRYSDTPDPRQPWRAGEHPLLIIAPDDTPEPQPLTTVTRAQRGDIRIDVADASQLHAGETYLVRQLEVEDGSLARDLVQNRVEVAANWRGQGTELVTQIVTLREVEGDCITLDAPLHRGLGPWPMEVCRFPMLHGAGIADLRMRGMWGGYFIHHKNGEHDNGWDQVKFVRVSGGWASNLVHENTTSALGLSDCLGCVVQHCRITGNPGHNGFVVNHRSTGNLFIGCHTGRNMHGFNIQGTLCGNAFVDCTMDEPCGIDMHGGVGCDNLFDSLLGGVNRGGGSRNAVPPRHSSGLVLWNWCCGHYNPYKVWRRYACAADHQTMPGFMAVGVHGAYGQRITYEGPQGPTHEVTHEDWGWIESPGQRVAPRSLYQWQCQRRFDHPTLCAPTTASAPSSPA